MNLFAIGLFGLALASQPAPDTGVDIAGFRGDCSLTTAGKTVACESLLYMHFKQSGRTSLSAVVGEGRMTSFSGGKDEQPSATVYWLEVDRLLEGEESEITEIPAKGRCDISLSVSGDVIHKLVCRATTKDGVVELRFSGNRMK
jgi:hypothetical protein